MQMIAFTKKKVKRIAAVSSMAAAAVAVGALAVFTSVGTQAAQRMIPIYSVERGDNKISLTFDVAWENSNTQELIDILEEYDAEATFFITGDWCDRYPEDVKKFYDAGHEIQNHSDQHPHVEGINVNELISDTKECSRKIEMITGIEPTLYRAPYGEYDDSLITTIEGMGMKPVQWDVDSVDWKEPTPEEIAEKVLGGVKSGSILLFHNDLKNTTEALPDILSQLKSKGYEFVKVSDLIYHENYTIDSSGKQIPDVLSSLELTPENVEDVMSQYADVIAAAGFSDEQIAQASQAIKDGGAIPDDVMAVISSIDPSVLTQTNTAGQQTQEANDNK
ncbi:MAG: polysaccharide deacetylase family protein [Oscillospiraceae bacterium]|nr:polysaccharide deacetylase family protein [Oscillospiraceae bacterium]